MPSENLKNGFQLILNVNPLKNGMTHAKLKAIDDTGLTLSIVKSDEYKNHGLGRRHRCFPNEF